jgi:hypothetical protein
MNIIIRVFLPLALPAALAAAESPGMLKLPPR